jgi:hypothetical protein
MAQYFVEHGENERERCVLDLAFVIHSARFLPAQNRAIERA